MKLDRFWMVQIVIILILFTLLIGSYLFSFGLFADKPATNTATVASAPVVIATTPEATPTTAPTVAPTKPTEPAATCTSAGVTLSSDTIRDSLSSSDAPRQASCLAFLQAESLAGDKGAEVWLGQAHHHGWGVAKNLQEAAKHYRQAAHSDDSDVRDSAQQWLQQLEQETQH
ncbi:MAG: SEL1-like repeat protein [Candidatus Thiothrix putei]|uniref:SEL1-like repeat protein n=1 Tax=Candidatus Thiothrix putei TaxID=3080811 RepID=A0AA95KIP4_9GAMM|nr:MAG: SEL1-like repeat protein [Candidatus Thiothrix putei]